MNRRHHFLFVGLLVISALVVWLYRPVERRIAAAELLRAMASEDRGPPPRPGALLAGLELPDGTPLRARSYGPEPEAARISIVLVHGIHYLGIEEPRLVRFARHLSDQGCRVLTPELRELADYQITQGGVSAIRAAVEQMASRGEPVGLIGFSFAGGLSLLAASEPATAKRLKYVASVGGYHDLHRALRFLATHKVESPTGITERHAHEYGLLVLLYGHLQSFDLGEDLAPFRRALKSWLMEDRETARKHADKLQTDQARKLFQLIEQQQLSTISERVLSLLSAQDAELRELSPAGHLKDIHTEVLFLHGSGDSVVPPEETLFAEEELKRVKHPYYQALITPLLEHVRVEHPGDNREKLALLGLVSKLL